MSLRHAAALALVGWYVLTPPFLWAQGHTEALKTFTAPDGAFSFRYWDHLINCEQKKQRGGEGYHWIPENCSAYVPVCDDLEAEGQTSVVCFAYPRNKFTNTPAFDAATFSVEVVDQRNTEERCLDNPDSTEDAAGTVRINGVSFAAFDGGDAAAGKSTDGSIYRTFHRGKCYQLGINVATAHGTFDPPVRELRSRDLNEVKGKLEQARKSFRFLK
jgi:hypothetical protein